MSKEKDESLIKINAEVNKDLYRIIKSVSSAEDITVSKWIQKIIEREAKKYKSLVDKISGKQVKEEEVIVTE